MNNDKNILQLLDQSACLRKSQLLGYLNHNLYPEELRVVELHLSSCALCSDALEGMETVQNAEQLIASITLPVLPAIVLPEKTQEKKEIPPVKVAEPAALNHPKGRHPKATLPSATISFEHDANAKKKTNWARPLGIAAALLIGAATLWYFKFGRSDHESPIAMNENRDSIAPAAAPQSTVAAVKSDSINNIILQKKKDSVYLAQRKAEKLLAEKDSLKLLAAKYTDTAAPAADRAPLMAAAKESPKVAASEPVAVREEDASESVAAKKKEEAKPASDYELGMQKYKDNNFASALLYFKTAESDEKNPKHWDAVYYSGMCNKSLNKKRKAIKYFERVVAAKAPLAKAAQKQLDNLNEK